MTTDQLIQSLIATTETEALYLDDTETVYLDWSTRTLTGVQLEVSDGAEVVQVEMTRDDVQHLQQALTLWLLQNPAA